jgi:LysR family glycine cleavage system transcriptional activator
MTTRLPALPALRAFDAVARLGSLTGAAADLHVTHGAISHQIKALESELGTAVLERAGRGVRLTSQGERFALHVRAALDRLASGVQELQARGNARRIRVSVVPSFAARWLLPRLGRFMRTHPDVDLEVGAAVAMVDFQRDDVDLAIRHGHGPWPGVIAEPLFDETRFVVCSPRLPRGRMPRHPGELARYVLLRGEAEPWEPWFRAAGLDWPEPSRGPLFNDSSHMMQAAAEGQGVAVARESLLGNDLATGALVRPFDLAVPAERRFYLVHPPRLAGTAKVALFRAWLLAELEADPMLATGVRSARAAAASDEPRRAAARGARRRT